MSSTTRSVALGAVLWCAATFSSAAAARADTIRITSGALQFGETSGQLSIAGERGFTLQAGVDVSGGIYRPWEACSVPACGAGATIPLGASWSGNDLPGAATLDGTSYPNVGSLGEIQSALARFDGQAVAPAPSLGPTAVVSAPFTFSGLFFEPSDVLGEVRHDLAGSGLATLWLARNSDGTTWRAVGSLYQFENAVTPEPATLVLVGSGIAFVLARRRLRGSRR